MSNFKRTTFYIGFTNYAPRRVIEHKLGVGGVYTNKYKCKFLVYFETYKYVNDAIAREKEIKKWRREKKINLIKEKNFNMLDLTQQLFEDCDLDKKNIEEIVKNIKSR